MEMEATQFSELKNRVDEIHAALIGNPISGDGGLVRQMKDCKRDISELKTFKDKSKWTASILIGFAGILGWVADKLIDLFTKH